MTTAAPLRSVDGLYVQANDVDRAIHVLTLSCFWLGVMVIFYHEIYSKAKVTIGGNRSLVYNRSEKKIG